MPKEKSPLRILQREGDTLKKEIDAYMEECGLVLDDSSLKDRTSRMKKLFDRCGTFRKKCKSLEKKLLNLSKGKEPTVIPNFDEVKDDEVERMHTLEVRLEKIGNKLEPDEVEESYFNKVKDDSMEGQGSKPPTGEIDDDSDDDDDDDDEGEEVDDEEAGGEQTKMDTTNPEEENDGDVDKEDDGKKTKFKRLGMFRRSKSEGKLDKTDADAEKEKKDKDKKDKDKKGKEKSEKEKEKEKEKERKEQEKKEKKEKEKLEKERKEKEKKEQKEKEQEEKRRKKEEKELAAKSGKNKKGEDGNTKKDKDEEKRPDSPSKRGFGAKLFNRDSKKPKIDETKKGESEDESEEEIDDEEEEEDMEEEDEVDEEGEDEEEGEEEEQGEEEEEQEDDDDEEEDEEEEEEVVKKDKKKVEPKQDKKKGWSLFRRDKSPQRQIKKDNEKDAKKRKEDKKQVRVQEEEEEEEEDEEEEDDEEYEDEEEEEEEEEESDDDQVVMKGKKAPRVESEEEEEDSGDEEEEDELEDEEESEEEVFENESEEEEENFKPPDDGMDLFEAVCDFDGEEDDDLYFKRGAILTILNVREDGWWMAEDEEGNKGLVPSTYLKLKKDHNDFRDVQSPDVDEPAQSMSPRSGRELWRGLRKSVTETGVTDVLTAMGAIPAGFRPSTTARHLKSDAYTLCNFLKPRFTESCLGFQDLNWSPHENQIRAKTVRLQKILTVLMVRNMPPCGVGIEIRSRHVRMCFFDGDKILSNIHTIQATWNKNDPKTWRFSPKVTSLLPSILDGDCFIRSSRTEESTGLLFELCLSYVRPKTGEKGELSCGWVFLPLYDPATGAPIVNKMYDLQVQGGTPFEQDVEVDPSISRRTSSSKFRSMMSANKQPRLQIKFLTPTKEQKPVLDLLPEMLVSSLGYLPFLSIFRNLQAVEVLRDRIDLQNADLIHCPVLSNFPEATKYPDIMDALRSCWADKKLKNKKIDKKNPEQMKELFMSAFMDSVYPIMRLPSLPPYKWGDEERDSERWQVISEFLQSNKQKGILASFLAPGGEHSPFDMTEVAYNLLDSFQELK